MSEHPDPDLIALGVRQPWAELIVRGEKTIEVRSSPVSLRQTIYIYASKRLSDHSAAKIAIDRFDLDVEQFVFGRIVGTVEITDCVTAKKSDASAACVREQDLVGQFGWQLSNPRRLAEPLAIKHQPFGIWFYPFRRKTRK